MRICDCGPAARQAICWNERASLKSMNSSILPAKNWAVEPSSRWYPPMAKPAFESMVGAEVPGAAAAGARLGAIEDGRVEDRGKTAQMCMAGQE